METIEKKLDMIMNKIDSLDERLQKVEKNMTEVHQFVPFVGWLENQGKRLTGSVTSISRLPSLLWKKDE